MSVLDSPRFTSDLRAHSWKTSIQSPKHGTLVEKMKPLSGRKLLEERDGEGRSAQKGDRVVYNSRLCLNEGDEVLLHAKQVQHLPQDMIRVEAGVTFVDHKTVLGSPQTMTGVEHALIGMKVDGYRKVRISPHLAYHDIGIRISFRQTRY